MLIHHPSIEMDMMLAHGSAGIAGGMYFGIGHTLNPLPHTVEQQAFRSRVST